MLKHLPRSGLDFLLYIFNLSWTSHSFPSMWKTSSIIPIHKMGKPLDSPASFWPISLTCVSKLFERIILSRLLFFLESNSILSPRQAGFRPGRFRLVAPSPAASRPPLRVTLTHFTLSSYVQALRLPTSFPISGLARLGVKPKLCRSSWRAFVSTHPLKLPSTSLREAVLVCPPFPPWNLPSFTTESTLTFPCSRSDPPLSRQGAALAHLETIPPHDLILWTDASVPFPFGKGGSGVLANCSLRGTEATLSFSAGPVCSSFSAEAYAILHALC